MNSVLTDFVPTVLAVDDNEDARTSLAWLLQANGFRVLEAGTAQEALRLARHRPDLVVLDVVLPDRDGFEVCRLLKADPDTAHTPVLMVSGYAVGDDDRVHGLDGGADAYLTKPADPALLLAHLHALLRVRRAEEAARASEARFRAIIESSDTAIVSTGPDWVVESWNPAAERLFGYTPGEMVGRSILDLVPADQHQEARRMLERVQAGERVPPYEAVRVRNDGRPVHVAVNPWSVRDAGGRFLSLAAVYTDLTEKRRLEEHLRQAQKLDALGRLAGGVAHDFNNLLTVINGYSELLLELFPGGDPRRGLAEDIHNAGERAAGLTRQLLAFGRKAVVAPQVLDLNDLVGNMERMLRRLIGEDIDLAVRLQPGLGFVRADPGQVEQVVMNLCVNARDAMPGGGKLTIETRVVELVEGYAAGRADVRPGSYVLLAVTDTGVGMTPDVLEHVFEPFFTTKEVGRGTGLGLATVYGIVQQAGGHVGVSSEPGQGTTFTVSLPRADELATGRPESPPSPAARGSETVLLVEDEEAVRALARVVLQQAGYTVLDAWAGDEAVRVAGQYPDPIHLLVTDVVMPGMGGRELADRLLLSRPGMGVLYMSGYTDDAVVRNGVLGEVVRFLQKPFTTTGLTRAVRDALDATGKAGQPPGRSPYGTEPGA
ncbi:MAG: sensor histidine kinase [Gemmataceae bacterium]|nr:sensor histidine kinase [Gemmataceae bacterium]